MKTLSSIKLHVLSAIRTRMTMLAIVLVLAAILNACSTKEELTPTPVEESSSNNIAGRVGFDTGLRITSNGNNVTIIVGSPGNYPCGSDNYNCQAIFLYYLVLGRNPESPEVIVSTGRAIRAFSYPEVRKRLANSEESRQNIRLLYRKALKKEKGEITNAEIERKQAELAFDKSLARIAEDLVNSQDAIDKGLNITVKKRTLLIQQ